MGTCSLFSLLHHGFFLGAAAKRLHFVPGLPTPLFIATCGEKEDKGGGGGKTTTEFCRVDVYLRSRRCMNHKDSESDG